MSDLADRVQTRAWKSPDGEPRAPRSVLGCPVARVLLAYDEQASAVVPLADGRCALTGHRLVVGTVEAVRAFARRRGFKTRRVEATCRWMHRVADHLTVLAAERARNAARP